LVTVACPGVVDSLDDDELVYEIDGEVELQEVFNLLLLLLGVLLLMMSIGEAEKKKSEKLLLVRFRAAAAAARSSLRLAVK
jgi:hypothetical protein